MAEAAPRRIPAPRAAGTRSTYGAMPAAVRDWVTATLGSPVVAIAEQTGGFSPGCATRLTCADGTRAFVKAVGAPLNPDSPTFFRREVLALTLLGSHPLWADLLASYDDGDWVALLLEDVEGHHPDLDDDATMDALVEATDELGRVMRERVPAPPQLPGPDDGGLNDMAQVYLRWTEAFDHLEDLPRDLVPRWVLHDADDARKRVAALAAEPADRFVHWDIRNDNLLQRPDGTIVFLDWGAAGRGNDWLDPMLARLERVHLPWFDRSLASSPALVRAGDDAVTSLLVGIGTYLAWRTVAAVDVNLPGLGDFRRVEAARFLGAAARRSGLPATI